MSMTDNTTSLTDPATESAILTTMTVHPELVDTVCGQLRASDFQVDQHRKIFVSYSQLNGIGHPVDMLSVDQDLVAKRRDSLLTFRGLEHQADISADELPKRINILRALSARRRVASYAQRLVDDAGNPETTITALMQGVEAMRETLSDASISRVGFIPTNENRPPHASPILTLNGHRIGSPGNLVALIANPGTGKSNVCGAICARKLNPECDSFGIGVNTDRAVLYLDTERSIADSWDGWNLTKRRAGTEHTIGVHWELLSTIDSVTQRRARLIQLIQLLNPGIVILDNGTDFVVDVNDPQECNPWIYEMLAMAKRMSFCLGMSIHNNPNDDSKKARGHFGSELMRKAESVLAIMRDQTTGQRTITMDFAHGKNRSALDNLESHFAWDAVLEMFCSCQDGRTEKPAAKERHNEMLRLLDGKKYSYTELVATVAKATDKSTSAAKGIIKRLSDKGRIVQKDMLWVVSNEV